MKDTLTNRRHRRGWVLLALLRVPPWGCAGTEAATGMGFPLWLQEPGEWGSARSDLSSLFKTETCGGSRVLQQVKGQCCRCSSLACCCGAVSIPGPGNFLSEGTAKNGKRDPRRGTNAVLQRSPGTESPSRAKPCWERAVCAADCCTPETPATWCFGELRHCGVTLTPSTSF